MDRRSAARFLVLAIAILALAALLPVSQAVAQCPGGVCTVPQAATAPAAAPLHTGPIFDGGLRWRAYLRRTVFQTCRDNPDATPEEIKRLVLAKATGEALRANPQMDWEQVIAFIERLIPFIMQLIALFG